MSVITKTIIFTVHRFEAIFKSKMRQIRSPS